MGRIVATISLCSGSRSTMSTQYIPLESNHAVLPLRPFFPNDSSSLMTIHVDNSKAVNYPLPAGTLMIHGAKAPLFRTGDGLALC